MSTSIPGKSHGKFWAAVHGNLITGLVFIPLMNKEDPRYIAFRDQAKEALSQIGDVITGEIQELNGEKVFVKRLTHINRSQNPTEPRVPKVYSLPPALR